TRRLAQLTFAATMLAVAAGTIREVADPDLWWHMATGRHIVADGRIPAFDVFSFTASSHRWVTHEWLSDLLLYGGYQLVGLVGLGLFFTLVITAAFALVYLRCRSKPVLAGCAVLLAALAASPTYGVRPQMFSLLFASLFLYILESTAGGGRRVWLLLPLTLVWANLHSGFVAGLAIIGVAAVGEELEWLAGAGRLGGLPHRGWLAPRARQLVLVALACLAASLVTPNGVAAVAFPFGTLSNTPIQASIQEWASPNFHQSLAWPLGAFWLALLGVLAASRRRLEATQLLLLVGASLATMYSMRHAVFLALVGAPLLAERAGELWPRPERAARPASRLAQQALWVVLGLLVVAAGWRIRLAAQRSAAAERELYPSAALAYMREHGIDGRVFNAYHWGGYLIWQGHQVFIDGRAEVYGDEVLGEYARTWSLQPGWERTLRRHGVEAMLVEAASPLARMAEDCGHWRVAYRDGVASVLVPAATPES
ncbi:MAG TPA: hypothetical protein PLG21_15175, partial [Anaerolineae bacterium]|nr:hypothetical protein [Anaerolineae bacterium]